MAKSDQLSVTVSVGTPLYPYGIAYRRAYGLFTHTMHPPQDTVLAYTTVALIEDLYPAPHCRI